jgi:hypothetical protein
VSEKQWTTRAGGATERAPELGQGADLRQLDRGAPKRDRLVVERQKQAQKQRLERELGRRADLESALSAAIGALTGQLARFVVGACLLLVVVAVGGPELWRLAFERPLSAQALAAREARIDLAAAKLLGGPVADPVVRAYSDRFELTYVLPAGAERFSARHARRSCSVVVAVSRDQHGSGPLRGRFAARRCR